MLRPLLGKMMGLKEQVEDLEISQPQGMLIIRSHLRSSNTSIDIDPEDDPFAKRDDDSDSDEAPSETGISGREHYEEVSKSKLRMPEQPKLGKEYTGTTVSRKTLFDDEGNPQVEAALGDDEEDDDDDDLPDTPEKEPDADPFAKSDSGLRVSAVESQESDVEDYMAFDGQNTLTDVRAEDLSDSEIDSDEAFGSGDEEDFKNKGFMFQSSKKDFVAEESAEDGDSDEDGALVWDTEDEIELDEDRDLEMEDGDSQSGSEIDGLSGVNSESDSLTSPEPSKKSNMGREKLETMLSNSDSHSSTSSESSKKPSIGRKNLKTIFRNDAATVASTLSASADAQKGKAVKQQYQTFDRLLDARIKLQKGLTAAKGLPLPSNAEPDVLAAAQSAEMAALKLFSTIESVRQSISDASGDPMSTKRKRPSSVSPSTSASTLWARMHTLEDQSLINRRTILNKWSSKTRAASGLTAPRSQLDNSTRVQESITSVLDAQIVSENQKLVGEEAYDDTDFYQSLLRDLISSRASLSQFQNTVSDIPLPSAPKQHRKGVDTKASKGRKVRYTVHEKLQNFTAEEDRGTWTESAKVEFFASLFGGQGKLLDENVGDDGEEAVGEEGALRLFRS